MQNRPVLVMHQLLDEMQQRDSGKAMRWQIQEHGRSANDNIRHERELIGQGAGNSEIILHYGSPNA